jgi:hypothetical protein
MKWEFTSISVLSKVKKSIAELGGEGWEREPVGVVNFHLNEAHDVGESVVRQLMFKRPVA